MRILAGWCRWKTWIVLPGIQEWVVTIWFGCGGEEYDLVVCGHVGRKADIGYERFRLKPGIYWNCLRYCCGCQPSRVQEANNKARQIGGQCETSNIPSSIPSCEEPNGEREEEKSMEVNTNRAGEAQERTKRHKGAKI